MNQKRTKSIYQFMLVLLIAGFTFTACNNGDKKKEEPAKTDTPAAKPADTAPQPGDTNHAGGGGDTLKQKPTAPAD